MKHVHVLSRTPRMAQNVPVEVKLTFLIDVFEAAIPLFEDKNPTNPADDGGDDDTTT